MKFKYKLTILFVLITLIFIFLSKSQLKTFYSELNEVFKITEKNETKPRPFQPFVKENETNLTETSPESVLEQISREKVETASKALTLEIIDICSGKLEDVFAVSEGVRYCLNKKHPYFIILEKNLTHIQTSFYNETGFNETYELNESTLIFFLFAEDIASVSKVVQAFYIEGNPGFYLGDYNLHTIWEKDPTGNLYISKMIAALPLYIKNTVSSTEWSELKFYLGVPNKNYYLGSLWIFVKEK